MKHFDVIIVGAGTAGLSARKQVTKKTQNYLVVDRGPLGTTCARVGCMPSKVLIQVANDIHQSQKITSLGFLNNGESLIKTKEIMTHVRALRDRFVSGVLSGKEKWEEKFILGEASFIDSNTLEINGEFFTTDKFIIATGSSPLIPKEWLEYKKFLIDTDSLFELEDLPKSMLVVGLGAIGFEMGQALSRLGVKVVGVNKSASMAGLSDPELQKYVAHHLNNEFPIFQSEVKFIGPTDGTQISAEIAGTVHQFEKVLVCVGRRPNLSKLKLENTGVALNEKGIPEFSSTNLSLKDLPHVFIAGDVNAYRSILHEATDEGKIAGHNAVSEILCYKRKVFLGITFSDPNIATIGERFSSLKKEKINFITGKVSFEGQGRAIVKLKEQGLLHIYASKVNGKILGAELQAPGGEHLAHLIAWVISMDMTVSEVLKLPFYHPVVEEGLRTALRDAAKQIENYTEELMNCDDPPIR